jgi:hypothetical protein
MHFINILALKKHLVTLIRDDAKTMKNISVDYELIQGTDIINAIDGHELFQKQKELYERQGFRLLKERKDVEIDGVKLKRLIFQWDENRYTGDHFGLASGYFQAHCEHVMYMKRF